MKPAYVAVALLVLFAAWFLFFRPPPCPSDQKIDECVAVECPAALENAIVALAEWIVDESENKVDTSEQACTAVKAVVACECKTCKSCDAYCKEGADLCADFFVTERARGEGWLRSPFGSAGPGQWTGPWTGPPTTGRPTGPPGQVRKRFVMALKQERIKAKMAELRAKHPNLAVKARALEKKAWKNERVEEIVRALGM